MLSQNTPTYNLTHPLRCYFIIIVVEDIILGKNAQKLEIKLYTPILLLTSLPLQKFQISSVQKSLYFVIIFQLANTPFPVLIIRRQLPISHEPMNGS